MVPYNIDFSVIVPVYNVERYLEQCIESILSQTYLNFELLLIDDGSTDLSSNICDRYSEKDYRVRVLHKENGGVCSARNLGIKESKGQYIVFIDSDDWVDNGYLQSLLSINDVELVCCSYRLENVKVDTRDWSILLSDGCDSIDFINKNITKFGFNSVCCKAFRTEIIKSNNVLFNEKISQCEDAIFVYDYLNTCKCRIKNIKQQPYHYRWDYKDRNNFQRFSIHETFLLFTLISNSLYKIKETYHCDVSYAQNELIYSQFYNIYRCICIKRCSLKIKILEFIKLINNNILVETLKDKKYMKTKRRGLYIYYFTLIYYSLKCLTGRPKTK